jgi:hypothetical protein
MVMGKRRMKNGRVRWTVTDQGSPERYRVPTSVPAATPTPAPAQGVDAELTLRAIESAVTTVLAQAARVGEPYISIEDACKKFDISRTTFYSLLPAAEAAGVAVRVPPPSGSVRIAVRRFEAWLVEAMKDGKKPRKRGARAPKGKE